MMKLFTAAFGVGAVTVLVAVLPGAPAWASASASVPSVASVPSMASMASGGGGPVACPGYAGSVPLASGNFLGNIIIGAFDVARVGIDAAEGIALTAVGAAGTPATGC
jgi:hypothetical protein